MELITILVEMAVDFVKRSLNIEDKVFLVTGGAAGVGAGVVRALLFENARVIKLYYETGKYFIVNRP